MHRDTRFLQIPDLLVQLLAIDAAGIGKDVENRFFLVGGRVNDPVVLGEGGQFLDDEFAPAHLGQVLRHLQIDHVADENVTPAIDQVGEAVAETGLVDTGRAGRLGRGDLVGAEPQLEQSGYVGVFVLGRGGSRHAQRQTGAGEKSRLYDSDHD